MTIQTLDHPYTRIYVVFTCRLVYTAHHFSQGNEPAGAQPQSTAHIQGKIWPDRRERYGRKAFDIRTSFRDVLGKTAAETPNNYERGELVVDTAMDLETNATTGLKRENSLLLQRDSLPDDAVIKMAQTFHSGTHVSMRSTTSKCSSRTISRPT